jgi:hypothetical protein
VFAVLQLGSVACGGERNTIRHASPEPRQPTPIARVSFDKVVLPLEDEGKGLPLANDNCRASVQDRRWYRKHAGACETVR